MLHFERWKIWSIAAVCLLGALFALPNLMPQTVLASWPDWIPRKQMSLGLDLRGGSHLLLEANIDELKLDWLKGLREEATKRLREAKIARSLGIANGMVIVRPAKPEDLGKAQEALRGMIQPLAGSVFSGPGGPNLEIATPGDGSITLQPTTAAITERISNGMAAVITTIERRVNALGTTEPTIARQGASRIIVQVPGFDDPTKLKETIGSTAKLSFHEVDSTKSVADAEVSGVPPGSEIRELLDREGGQGKILIKEAAVVDGDDLVDAQPSFDSQTQEPMVSFRFNTSGARKFGAYTAENVGRPFAIVLDGKVISAPVIRDAILGGQGQITGNFTVEAANTLAIQLRSGALPTSLTVVEERSVGPNLGADSIESGKLAALIGALATAALTIFAYGLFGVFAVVALIINGLLIVGVMSAMQSTLTLPGIAGMVLTIGMAVDSNVLIYERIREELRAGKTAINAIEAGFNRALVTIADSQLTTLAAALVMFWLGSGPIRGFAVTLSIGVITSVFTAVTVVRLIISLWLKYARKKQRVIEVPI